MLQKYNRSILEPDFTYLIDLCFLIDFSIRQYDNIVTAIYLFIT